MQLALRIQNRFGCLFASLAICTVALVADGAEAGDGPVEFNRDIRPILSDSCFHCHGPDKTARQAELRLDIQEAAFADREGAATIVRGHPEQSELFRRIASNDPDEQMPPADSGLSLSRDQIELVRRWIQQGAPWQNHWSFIAPVRPKLPAVPHSDGTLNGIDAFMRARLEQEGLSPSPQADRETLIRRVTFDLTGLPPTPDAIDAFLADESPNAYERVVDRLLNSPRFGERMATDWLDAARYADTNGYQTDGERYMWRWRDWVIDAFNRNMPFDQFTIEQLAGDLLPSPTLEQRIATGFNRNHRGNSEGGIIPEEYAVEYVVDRVDTTSTVWLGLTIACARCHEHKYDPIEQKEFYRLFAYFNNIAERGKAIKIGNSPPFIKAPTAPQQLQLAKIESECIRAESEFRSLSSVIAQSQAKWEASAQTMSPIDWAAANPVHAHLSLDDDLLVSSETPTESTDSEKIQDDKQAKQNGKTEESDNNIGSFHAGAAAFADGRIGRAAQFDGERFIDAGNRGAFGYFDKFSCGAWVFPTGNRSGAILSRATERGRFIGYSLALNEGRVQVNLVKRWLDDAIRVETTQSLTPGRWHHVMMTYDGSRVADGVSIYVDGQPQAFQADINDLNQSFSTDAPFRIGTGGGPKSRFHGLIDDVRVYEECLQPTEVALIATDDRVDEIVRIPPEQRSARQADKLHAYFLERHAPTEVQQARSRLKDLTKRKDALIESFPTTMVMQEREEPRETFVLVRGQYDRPSEKVSPGIPAAIFNSSEELPDSRLGLARWLVDSSNPLTARVIVNRYWQSYFGAGLVRTVEDFGSQGERPSHPQLLDWLATEFVRTGWNVKTLQKLIVTSATYRQSSRIPPELLKHDPENRLLARGPRLRLSAETIRDQALYVSGLLTETIGGRSVKPYQPAGLWKEIATAGAYQQDSGRKLYRRGLYTFWKRTVAPPAMSVFDAADREMCSVRRGRTNTPLQALTLMNDVTFVEAARVLAQRVMTESESTPTSRITHAIRLVLSRQPELAELDILTAGYQQHLAHYRSDEEAASELIGTGESDADEQLDRAELAAYTAVCGLILNLDETVTKQ